MNLVQVLKLCVLGAFVATVFTGVVFMMRSSDDRQIKEHVKDLSRHLQNDRNNKDGMDKFSDNAKHIPEKSFIQEENQPQIGEKFVLKQPPGEKESKDDEAREQITTTTPQPTTTTTSPKPVLEAQKVTITTPTSVIGEQKEVKETSRQPSIHIFYYPCTIIGTTNTSSLGITVTSTSILKVCAYFFILICVLSLGRHQPPSDIASNYYPALGPYSTRDPAAVDKHMKWMSSAGIDVVVASWYPPGKADKEGMPWEDLMPLLLNTTSKYKMKMAFHLEPYPDRTAESVHEDIKYIIKSYGDHNAFYRTAGKASNEKKQLPLFYVYDSYLIPAEEWAKVTTPEGSSTIRNTEWDALLIGLYVNSEHKTQIKRSGFDGLYTYFASEGFSHGSTMANWPALSAFCAESNLLFIPSVGPGYNDTRVRPWNGVNAKARNNGDYYKEHFKMAHIAKADIVSITSFNEWHEGTQIEPAKAFTDTNFTGYVYEQYIKGSEMYLEITLEMVSFCLISSFK
ncbi:glycosyl hydrolase family 99 domain-containing protein [Ditylenchus destructor]|uniref:Glycosyl hydrolase family 99 domain-containing protein n=1 Tax=Ditylenchus destructor TaxID=166010 RepID=A0AAD4R6B4_9BILA|nr:glycosyl hydrolase family 99 domain-containing protein [Ditylenchus destructor]